MTNPMDNSEMMNQMTQMAMVQALSTVTETLTNTSNMSTTTYAAGMVGKDVTVALTEENEYGMQSVVGSKHGTVVSVNLTNGSPTFRLEGDETDYPLSYLIGIGDITEQAKPDNPDESGEDLTQQP